MPEVRELTILSARRAGNAVDLRMEGLGMIGEAMPGQFVMISCGEDRLLRRPISVCDVESGVLRIVFEVRGAGTLWLSERKAGERLSVFGPLGNGYDLSVTGRPVLFVGGGIGAPPILYAMKNSPDPVAVLCGFRNREAVLMDRDFTDAVYKKNGSFSLSMKNQAGSGFILATDDGSLGVRGNVLKPLETLLMSSSWGRIVACGPRPMLKGIAKLAEKYKTACQVSLEERMGCGFGACLVCACATEKDGEKGYSSVCRDGPVFDAREVLWDA